MVTKDFAEASAELIKILEYLPSVEVEKIPLKLRNFFKKVADFNYNAEINPNIPIDEQGIKEKTKDLIAVIYRNYWCNEEERQLLDKQLNENDRRYEEQLREKYNPENLFKKCHQQEEPTRDDEKSIAIITEEKWYKKILSFIKRIFGNK